VPIPAGYDDADQSDEALTRAAAAIGLPLLVKPAAGGGGKGMRTVRDADRLLDALSAARREAAAAFGDDRLILERLVEGARHVEIQVLFDGHGHGVHLGERDCSIQRRHQKVLEETPSPAVDPNVRERMAAAALALAGSVGYENAGTCEFLLDERGAFTFLEMNTRLQVEHPVTELVTGRDLVADQLRIAAGEPLDLAQDDIRFEGHAVEVRLYAEDAEHGSLPATGRIERLRWPSGEGVRVDAGVVEGDVVGGRFDPMLAKIIAHAADRRTALQRLTAALDATVVLGLTTNLRFLRWLARQPVVLDGAARTDTLERIWPPDDWTDRTRIPDAAWTAVAAALLAGNLEPRTPRGSAAAGPWSGGFRMNAPPVVRVTTDEEARTVTLDRDAADRDGGLVGELVRAGDVVHVDLGGRSTSFRLAPPPDVDRAALAAARSHGGGPQELVAPMPGQVVALTADVGASVEAGDPIVTLEAMKMEHAVHATGPGTVAALFVAVGEQVERGQRLALIE
jgi:acetyl-CoA/propionyl-CoA carboxylase biotin carboxyl carrier protein